MGDEVASTLLVALDQVAQCAAVPIVVGDDATFPLNYAIPTSATLGVSDVVLAADVPTGTTFLGASDGGVESGGVIIWSLGDLLPGDAGQVTFDLRVEDPLTSLTIDSEMTCAEGLVHQASVVCLVLQPTPTPRPPTPTPSPTPTRPATPHRPPGEIPEPATVSLALGGLGGLIGFAAWRWRSRRQT